MCYPEDFYDGLVGEYDALFDDWWTAAAWHGDVVAGLLTARGVIPPSPSTNASTRSSPVTTLCPTCSPTPTSSARSEAPHESGYYQTCEIDRGHWRPQPARGWRLSSGESPRGSALLGFVSADAATLADRMASDAERAAAPYKPPSG
jgi:hypothetical protein